MARNERKRSAKAVGGEAAMVPVRGAVTGALFTVVWAILVALGVRYLLIRFDSGAETLTALIWPAVVFALGVPLIVFVWFGGFGIVIGLARLRQHLEKLDSYVSSFDEMESRSLEIRSKMDTASATVSSAANTFSANLDRFEQDVKPLLEKSANAPGLPAQGEPQNEAEDANLKARKRRLGHLINQADAVLYQTLSRRNESPGRGKRRIVVSPGGSDKAGISARLRDEQWLGRDVSDLMIEIYNLDMATRPTRRADLKDEQLSHLEGKISCLQLAQQSLTTEAGNLSGGAT